MRLKPLDQLQTSHFRKAVMEARNKATPDGVTVVDQKGKILLHNKKIGEIWHLPEEILVSGNDNAALQHTSTMVAGPEEGRPFNTEYYTEQIKKWLKLAVVKMFDNHLINVFRDIAVTKRTQIEPEQTVDRRKAVFNAAQSGMFTFAPVYDENENVIDFRFVIVNMAIASYVGKSS